MIRVLVRRLPLRTERDQYHNYVRAKFRKKLLKKYIYPVIVILEFQDCLQEQLVAYRLPPTLLYYHKFCSI